MYKQTTLVSIIVIIVVLMALFAANSMAAPLRQSANPPERITYQGHLLGPSNDPIPDGVYTMRFSLYAEESGGTALWGPEEHTVTTLAGYFSVLLGEGTPITADVLTTTTYLEVEVEGETLPTRYEFASVPFALVASDVNVPTLGDLACGDGEVAQWDELASAWGCVANVTGVTAGTGLIGSGGTGDVTLDVALSYRLPQTCSNGEIAEWNGTAWVCGTDDVGGSGGGGDITAVYAGTGLSGGGDTGDVTLNANTTYLQRRVSGSCPAGSSIRYIASNGTVTCETDNDSGGDITGVTAGTGLSGGGTSGNVTLSADTNHLQQRVAGMCDPGYSIRVINANGTVDCEADDNSGGDITAVLAGTGLSGGGTSGSVTLSPDTTYLQRRVSGSCPEGESIRIIDADGTVDCEPDTDTTVDGCSGCLAVGIEVSDPGGLSDGDDTDDAVSWSEISPIVGTGSSQVAQGNHNHDSRYYTESELSEGAADIHWDGLTNVPAGFADGTDDEGITLIGVTGNGLKVQQPSGPTTALGLRDCSTGQILKATSSTTWGCAADDTAYTHDHWGESWSGSGVGLTLSSDNTHALRIAQGSLRVEGLISANGIDAQNSGYLGGRVMGGYSGFLGIGSNANGFGVMGENNNGTGVYGRSTGGYAGFFNGGVHVTDWLSVAGDFTAYGTKSAVVDTKSYGKRTLYAIESPGVWFEDFGSAQLVDGQAVVAIEPIFAQTVNLTETYHVFVTPVCQEAIVLFVTDKSAADFTVQGVTLDGGPTECAFDYRIVAKRLGHEDTRLAPAAAPPSAGPMEMMGQSFAPASTLPRERAEP